MEASDHPSMEAAVDVRAAIELVRSAPAGAAVFITGSLYLVGEARAMFVK